MFLLPSCLTTASSKYQEALRAMLMFLLPSCATTQVPRDDALAGHADSRRQLPERGGRRAMHLGCRLTGLRRTTWPILQSGHPPRLLAVADTRHVCRRHSPRLLEAFVLPPTWVSSGILFRSVCAAWSRPWADPYCACVCRRRKTQRWSTRCPPTRPSSGTLPPRLPQNANHSSQNCSTHGHARSAVFPGVFGCRAPGNCLHWHRQVLFGIICRACACSLPSPSDVRACLFVCVLLVGRYGWGNEYYGVNHSSNKFERQYEDVANRFVQTVRTAKGVDSAACCMVQVLHGTGVALLPLVCFKGFGVECGSRARCAPQLTWDARCCARIGSTQHGGPRTARR